MPDSITPTVKKDLEQLLAALIDRAEPGNEFTNQTDLEIYWKEKVTGRLEEMLIVRTTIKALSELMDTQIQQSEIHTFKQKTVRKNTDHLKYILTIFHENSPNVIDMRPAKQFRSRNKRWDFAICFSQRSKTACITEILHNWGKPQLLNNPPPKIDRLLPHRAHLQLLDRETQIQQIHHWLNDKNSSHLIAIEGMGGMGKTSLALEIAHQCLAASENPQNFPTTFDAIIFTSVQPQRILGKLIVPRSPRSYSLQDILRSINFTLTGFRQLPTATTAQIEHIYQVISQRQPLIIVDNIESLAEQTELLDFLMCIPQSAKVIVTSRESLGLAQTIFLQPIESTITKPWLERQLRQRQINLKSSQVENLVKAIAGSPLAMEHMLSNIAANYHSSTPLQFPQNLRQSTQVIHEFCFRTNLQSLQTTPAALTTLLTLSFFAHPTTEPVLIKITQLSPAALRSSLVQLRKLHLINTPPSPQNLPPIPPLHSLLCSYITEQLDQQPELSQQLHNQWVAYYQNFAASYRERYWLEWHDYSALIADWSNLRSVVDWCIDHDRYQDVINFWQSLRGFTILTGHWEERQNWIDYLLAESQQRQDIAIKAEAIFQASQTLAYGNETDPENKALELALEAWQQRELCSIEWQFNVAILLATLYLRKQDNTDSQQQQAAEFIAVAHELTGKKATTQYHQCQILYYQAELHCNKSELDAALAKYQQALHLARSIGYKRCISYCTGRRAKIWFDREQFDLAYPELLSALAQSEKYQDQRSIAFCCFYLCQIDQQKQQIVRATDYAQRAASIFATLGMQREADMVRSS
jgi:tetratricopeptide (TPR) repeat protein